MQDCKAVKSGKSLHNSKFFYFTIWEIVKKYSKKNEKRAINQLAIFFSSRAINGLELEYHCFLSEIRRWLSPDTNHCREQAYLLLVTAVGYGSREKWTGTTNRRNFYRSWVFIISSSAAWIKPTGERWNIFRLIVSAICKQPWRVTAEISIKTTTWPITRTCRPRSQPVVINGSDRWSFKKIRADPLPISTWPILSLRRTKPIQSFMPKTNHLSPHPFTKKVRMENTSPKRL